jgi:hypothetical protein
MADFDDVPLRRSSAESPGTGPSSRLPIIAAAGIAVVLLIGGLLWYLGSREDSVSVQETTEQAVATPSGPEQLPAEPGDDIDLPPLDETDPLIRDLVSALSSHPRVAAYLTTDHLVRNMTVVVVNIADGRTPSNHLGAVRPRGDFQVREDGVEFVIDRRTYERYNDHAAAIQGLDAQGVARFYATIRPRIDDAYRDLGQPHGSFDDSLRRAIIELLRTPIPEGEVRVRGDSVAYTYADPKLESLSHAQRQFLRMGPENMRIVKAKLREVAHHIGIPPAALPE